MAGGFCLFLSVCVQPGITIPSIQGMELFGVAGEPGFCANAVKLKALVIASARVVILISSPRA
jgi:hypothetical protein